MRATHLKSLFMLDLFWISYSATVVLSLDHSLRALARPSAGSLPAAVLI
jgi:hypothetical protein